MTLYAVLHTEEEEAIPHYRRLYKKRANMALALYHQIHPVSSYFSSLACSRSVLPLIYLAVLCQLFSLFFMSNYCSFPQQVEHYKFLRLRLNDVFKFVEHGPEVPPCYMHMNFMAVNVKTGSEKLFFAELSLLSDIF